MSFDQPLNQDAVDAEIIKSDSDRITKSGKKELEAIDGVRIASEKYNENRDLANQLLGQAQMAGALQKVCRLSALLKLRFVKENKLYRHIKTADGQHFSWKMYCDEYGTSHKTVDEQLLNLQVFGEEAMSAFQRMDVGYRELRKLRKLPEEDRQIIIESEAIDTGDKDAVRELLEDIVSKHAKEKEVAAQREETLKEALDASNKIMADKDARFNALEKELHLRSGRTMPWQEKVAPLKDEMNMVSNVLDEALGRMLVLHQSILGLDMDDDVRDIARRSMVTRYKEVLDRAAVLVSECQGQFDLELGGYIGAMHDFIMQVPGEAKPAALQAVAGE